jgi:putative ABC transport system permease protein
VPPLRALRRDLGVPPASEWAAAASAAVAVVGLIHWQAGDPALANYILLAVGAVLGLLALLGYLLVRGAGWLQGQTSGVARLGLATLARHRGSTLLQVLGFGLGILALLLLAVVRLDLLRTWEQSLPEGTPNRFLVNVQPDQVEALRAFLAGNGVPEAELFPMIRGRLERINEREVRPEDYTEPRAERLAAREFNLSWAGGLQSDNRVVAGRWWGGQAEPGPAFSVERGLAETLGIRMGDRLTFRVAGQEVSAEVTSLRSVQWDSFNVNFFVIGTPGLLSGLPSTYVTSFYLPASQDSVTAELIRQFPTVTLLDVEAIMQQVRGIMDRGVMAVEYVFLFTLLAGVLVMYAGIHTNFEERMAATAVLRTLGARRRQLLVAVAVEFTALGLLSGLLASLFAEVTGEVLARELFGLDFAFNPVLWLTGVVGSAVGVGIAGTLATYPLLVRPPLRALRRA